MQNFTKGLLIGGIIGAAGLTYAVSDKRTRKRLVKDGRKMLNKAENLAGRMDIL